MSILSGITTGATRTGIRVVLAAQEKMGKTTIASQAPGALLVPLEVGYAGVTIAKTPMLQALEQVWQLLGEVTELAKQGKFPFRTIVLDSATALERMIHDYVLRCDPAYKPGALKQTVTMESAHGGYGKAYQLANKHFSDVLGMLDVLAVYGNLNVVFTCHVFSSKVMDPTSGEYDSWDILLHSPKNQKTYGKREIITQWADVIGFLYDPVYLTTTDNSKMVKAVSQNKGRQLGLSRTPAYTAGNRFGFTGEVTVPAPPANGWNALAGVLAHTAGIDVYTR